MKESNKINRIISLLLLISIIVTVFYIRITYAKYQEKLGTSYKAGMHGWYITLNNQDIYNKTDLSEFLTPVFSNDIANYTASNVIVPGSEQYLLFVVDYSKVDVKFNVKISVEQLNTEKLKFFEVKGYTNGNLASSTSEVIDNKVDINEIASQEYVIDDIIDAPNTENKVKYYKVYVHWNDDAKDGNVIVNGISMKKNQYDTDYVGNSIEESAKTKLIYKATATFIQVNATE